MTTSIPHAHRRAVGVAAVLVLAFTALLRIAPDGSTFLRWTDDLGQSGAAFIAATAALLRARAADRSSTSWLLVALATTAWGCGQLVFSWYDLISHEVAPVPSFADLGFLLFPVLGVIALCVRPSAAFKGRGRARTVLDGVLVAAGLCSVSWSTVLGEVIHGGAGSTLSLVTLMAYPIGDVLMISLAIIVLVHARLRSGLLMMCCGLIAMSVADSVFVYLVTNDEYRTGMWIDSVWFGAFILIALSAVLQTSHEEIAVVSTTSIAYLTLPYVFALIGFSAAVTAAVRNNLDRPLLVSGLISVMALLGRQFLTLLDNRALVQDVARTEKELRYRAFHDALTGLANRSLFADRVEHSLDLHRRDRRPVALLFCDLDDFKTVNDTLGHDAGDVLLQTVARRLDELARSGDTVARLGGDEFALLIEDSGDPTELSKRIIESLGEPVLINGRAIPVRVSIGVAALDRDDAPIDGQELLKRADVAMYAAKQNGKSTFVSYNSIPQNQIVHDLDLRLALTQDIASGRIRVAFQPIVQPDGTVSGYEALARWSSLGGSIPPDRFIPLAERSGMIIALDSLVIEQGVRALADLDAAQPDAVNINATNADSLNSGPAPMSLAVNLGLSHISDPDLPARLGDLLADYGIAAERLIVEISEREAISTPQAMAGVAALRARGVRLAIDDFGVGFSSLNRIGLLEPHIIKLDRSLIDVASRPGATTDLLSAIIDLAHRVGAIVVAEGIETEQQRATLCALGCDALQGYLLGRPVEGPLVGRTGTPLQIVA